MSFSCVNPSISIASTNEINYWKHLNKELNAIQENISKAEILGNDEYILNIYVNYTDPKSCWKGQLDFDHFSKNVRILLQQKQYSTKELCFECNSGELEKQSRKNFFPDRFSSWFAA